MRLIDADELEERFATLEAEALNYIGKLNERNDSEEHERWVVWTAILNERTAFKHDVTDAPTADDWQKYSDALWKNAYERGRNDAVRHGKWLIPEGHSFARTCSECGCIYHKDSVQFYDYCPNCGAKMDAERKAE